MRTDAYALQLDNGNYRAVREAVAIDLIESHLRGEITLGTYVVASGKCRFAVLDVDVKSGFDHEDHIIEACDVALQIRGELVSLGLAKEQVPVEHSGRRGFHVWLLFEDDQPVQQVFDLVSGVKRRVASAFPQAALPEPISIETYPKTRRTDSSRLGSLIKVPLGLHRVSRQWSHFVSLENREESEALPHEQARSIRLVDSRHFSRLLDSLKIPQDDREQSADTPDVLEVKELGSEAVDILRQRCSLIQRCFEHPDRASYDRWLGCGSNLYPLGQSGIDAWRALSEADFRRYDPEDFDNKVREFEAGLKPYGCRALGCDKDCGVGRPIDLLKYLSAPQTAAPERHLSFITLEEARSRLSADLDEILQAPGKDFYLVSFPQGVGKSYMLAHKINELQRAANGRQSCLWLAPTHQQAKDIERIISGAVRLKSRQLLVEEGLLECPYVEEISACGKRGFPSQALYCMNEQKCPRSKRDQCTYLRRWELAYHAPVVIGMHSHLATDTVVLLNKDLLVIDENALRLFRHEVVITAKDVEYTRAVLQQISSDAQWKGICRQAADALSATMNGEFRPSDYSGHADNLEQVLAQIAHLGLIDSGDARLLLRDLQYLKYTGVTPRPCKDGAAYYRTARLPRCKTIMLDATSSKEAAELILGQKVKEFSLDGKRVRQEAKIAQVLGGHYFKTSIDENGPYGHNQTSSRLMEAVDAIGNRKDCSVVSHKAFIEQNSLAEKLGEDRVAWFYNLRGLNQLQNSEVVIVAGFPMPPVETMVKDARILFGVDWNDDEIEEQVLEDLANKVTTPILTAGDESAQKGLVPSGVEIRFRNRYIQAYFECFVQAEYEQAVGRARVHLSLDPGKHKEVFVICDQPLRSVAIDEVVRLSSIVPSALKGKSKFDGKIRQVVLMMRKTGESPTMRKIAHVVGCSRDTVKRWMRKNRDGLNQ